MDTSIAITVIFYRISTVLCGLAFAYLGYRLFCLGISEKAGELKAAYGDSGLILRQVAPGIYFALFGTLIVGFSIFRGIDITTDTTEGSLNGAKKQQIASTKDASSSNVPDSNATGLLSEIDPSLDLDTQPIKLINIIEKMQIDGESSLDNVEKELLKIWMIKRKSRITASQGGAES